MWVSKKEPNDSDQMTVISAEQSKEWLAEHGDYLYRFALARLRDQHQAEDVVQETFIAALQSSAFEGKSSPRTWLTGILKHKIIDLMRKNSRETAVESFEEHLTDSADVDDFFDETGHWADSPQSWGKPEGELEQKQFLLVMQDCLAKLPPKLASLFMLREVHEEDNEIICKELDISPTNAWVMLHRARLGLRKCVELNWL